MSSNSRKEYNRITAKRLYVESLIHETKNLARNVLPTGLLVVHNTSRGGQDNVTELTGRQQIGDPVLNIVDLDVEAGRDNTNLIETAIQENGDLSGTMVVDELEIVNVA